MELYKGVVSPALDHLDSERMHIVARDALHLAERLPLGLSIAERFAFHKERFTDEKLHVVLGGVEFDNPLMVGAGWDKVGKAVAGLHRLGFAGVEVGSVLAYPQSGNKKPRQFMVGPGVALNRLGFNSPGMEVVAKNLEKYTGSGIPIGVSIGLNKLVPAKSAPEMHAHVVRELFPYASYFAINVSSPNTPGLRALQDKEPLTDIVQAVLDARNEIPLEVNEQEKPIFIKIAPDLVTEDIDDVIDVVLNNGLTGIIATNTTNNESIKSEYGVEGQMGGISGNDETYRGMSTAIIQHIYRESKEKYRNLEIIGVGGVHDTQTALEKIQAGARVVQIVTAIREVGPTLPGRINRGLVDWMSQHGISSIEELVGSESNR